MDASDKVFEFLDRHGRGLEVGPAHSPYAPKAAGFNVVTVDHATKPELIEKYRTYAVPEYKLNRIEDVDYIWSGEHLADLVPGEFDYVIASHFIEHTVDIIGFLKDCENLLKPNGKLSLVIPDKRYCFDLLRPLSTVGNAIDSHLRPSRFHTPGTVIDAETWNSSRDGVGAWAAGEDRELHLTEDISSFTTLIDTAVDQKEYHDCHHWVFTPSSFELLLRDLRTLGYTKLSIVGQRPTSGCEFYVTLSAQTSDANGPTRKELFRRIEHELGAVSAFGDQCESDRAILELRVERDKLRRMLAKRDRKIQELKAEQESIFNSRSWKATKPLRLVSRKSRKISRPA